MRPDQAHAARGCQARGENVTPDQMGEARSGLCPETRQGALPPGPPPEARLWTPLLVGVWEEGLLRHCNATGGPPPTPQPTEGFQGPALGGVPRGGATWWRPGAKPLAFLRPGEGPVLRGGGR